MKKHILSFVVATAFIAVIAAGCGSQEKASGSDTTATDSSTMMKDTTAAPADTSKMTDTTKKDTVKM